MTQLISIEQTSNAIISGLNVEYSNVNVARIEFDREIEQFKRNSPALTVLIERADMFKATYGVEGEIVFIDVVLITE